MCPLIHGFAFAISVTRDQLWSKNTKWKILEIDNS